MVGNLGMLELPYRFKLGIMISDTVRYNVATLKLLPKSPYVHFKNMLFFVFYIHFLHEIIAFNA